MVSIIINLPDERLNKLNNFYIDNFGYEIHTQIQNFINKEYEKCEEYSTEKPEPQPIPAIHNSQGTWKLKILYPDDSTRLIQHDDYDLLLNAWNEWSKHSFSKEYQSAVLKKYFPDRNRKYISKMRNKYSILKNGKQFGTYRSLNDALLVRDFLMENDWDMKYHSSNIIKYVDGITQYNSSDYLLKIAKGEVDYDKIFEQKTKEISQNNE